MSRARIGFQMAALFTLPFSLALGLVAATGGTSLPIAVLIPAVATAAMGVAGWVLAYAVGPPPERVPMPACLALSVIAVFVGATSISLVAVASSGDAHGLDGLTSQAFGIAWFGMVSLGVPAIAITFPLAIAWAAVVRTCLGEEAEQRHVGPDGDGRTRSHVLQASEESHLPGDGDRGRDIHGAGHSSATVSPTR